MRYWWVNHKQTFRHEFEGQYIWSPKRKRGGSRNQFYDFLREVVPGDVVFSYSHGMVQGAGFAISYCYTCPRPAEFGHIGELWDIVGWRVDVRFKRFERPIRPKSHLAVLGPLLAREDKAPLRPTGNGQQHIYLTSVSPTLAQVLMGLAGPDAQALAGLALEDAEVRPVERELVGQQEWEDLEQRRITTADLPETTRTALVRARIGQGVFKERVHRWEIGCRLTLVTNPTHLVGSHIKPWRDSSDVEKLDGNNGLLLAPHVDHLFDRGYIAFADSGELLLSPLLDASVREAWGIPEKLNTGAFTAAQSEYLAYHRGNVFRRG